MKPNELPPPAQLMKFIVGKWISCKHLGQPCETLKCIEAKKLEFCFQCEEFPCVKLQPAKEGADRFPHNFKLFNLCRIKTVGVEKWAEQEAKLIRQRYFLGKFIPGTGPVLKG